MRAKPIVEKEFEYRGYKCAVLFQPMGFRCGYVRIPKTSKFFKKEYYAECENSNYSLQEYIDVHGGITYSRNYLSCVEEESNDTWWIGWDYAHYGDCDDTDSLVKYYNKDLSLVGCIDIVTGYGRIYYIEDVIADCKHVVDQLIKIEGE